MVTLRPCSASRNLLDSRLNNEQCFCCHTSSKCFNVLFVFFFITLHIIIPINTLQKAIVCLVLQNQFAILFICMETAVISTIVSLHGQNDKPNNRNPNSTKLISHSQFYFNMFSLCYLQHKTKMSQFKDTYTASL